MRAHRRPDDIVCILHATCPLAHRLVYCIFQNLGAGFHVVNLRSEKFHPVNIKLLSLTVALPHEHLAFQSQQCCSCGGCDAMLSGASLCDDPCLSHLLGKQNLPQAVIDLVRPGMVQIFPLQVYFRTSQILRHLFRVIKP